MTLKEIFLHYTVYIVLCIAFVAVGSVSNMPMFIVSTSCFLVGHLYATIYSYVQNRRKILEKGK